MRTESDIRRKLRSIKLIESEAKPCTESFALSANEQIRTLAWVLGARDEFDALPETGQTTLSRELILADENAKLKAEIKLLRDCHYFKAIYSHVGCSHARKT